MLANRNYDVVTLDSRLGGNTPRKPRIHQLLQRVAELEGTSPTVVALTNFTDDLTNADTDSLYDVIKKSEVSSDVVVLKRRLLKAAHESLVQQARAVLLKANCDAPSDMDEELFSSLQRIMPELEERLASLAQEVVDKYYLVYLDHFRHLPEEVLTCEGIVVCVGEEYVDVELFLADMPSLRRFSRDRFLAAGALYENARFRYRITRYGAEVRSVIEPVEEEQQDQEEENDIDWSVFDHFDGTKHD